MRYHPDTRVRKISVKYWLLALAIGAILLGAGVLPAAATDRSGKEVVAASCGACHTIGKDGAPKIGDKKAWAQRASRGLTSLTESALAGIRKMPAHGGNPDTSELEISRATTYMINQSGGKWIEPVGNAKPVAKPVASAERSGESIVQMQCGKCHLTGESGAPKIGDRAAWVQRLKRGLDEVVRSAFNGHGPMPARGGMADITANEMRAAITYMFNPASAMMLPSIAVPAQPRGPFHKVVGNTEIFFGVVSADSIRAVQKSGGAAFAEIPTGADYYYVSVTLRDRTSKVTVANAQVDVRVEDPAIRGETKTLDIFTINQSISYGSFFAFPTKGQYFIDVKIQRPGSQLPSEARFEFNRH